MAKPQVSIVVQEEVKQQNKRVTQNLVLDPSKVREEVPFVFAELDDETIGIGILLPKNEEIKVKGKPTGHTRQEWRPFMITNKGSIHPITNGFKEDYAVEFEEIPDHMNLRWTLDSIRRFLLGDDPELDHDIQTVFNLLTKEYEKYYVERNPSWHKVQALWDMATYFFLIFDFFPIMELRGHKRTGKTKIMRISRQFTFNASEIMINPTESSLFRETHSKRFTKYIDEAEKIWRYDANQNDVVSDSRAELLNASVQKGSKVPRVEKVGNRFKTCYYSSFSPTMIASIYGLKGATEDRAIVRFCVRAPEEDPRGDLEPDPKDEFYKEVRNDLYLILLTHWEDVKKEYKGFKNDTSLKTRDFQIWKPLLSLAKVISEDVYKEVLTVAEEETVIKKSDSLSDSSLDYKILKVMYHMLGEGLEWIGLKEIGQAIDPHNPVHSKTIASHCDKLGLRGYRKRTEQGEGYELFRKDLIKLAKQTYPQLNFSKFDKTEKIQGKKQKKIQEEDMTGLSDLKQQIIDKVEDEEQVEIQDIVTEFGDEAEKAVKYLCQQGELYQPFPGKVRRV